MKIRTQEDAVKFRREIEKLIPAVDDLHASEAPDLYPMLRYEGELVPYGTRVQFEGGLWKAAQDLWDREENSPANAPALWTKVMYHDGIRIIPETFTAADAFSMGELGFWEADGKTYRSMMEGNVYTPAVAPAMWELVTEGEA